MVIQYCRYCCHAIDYKGGETDFICRADAKCGNNGCGKCYDASKAKRPNRCKHFDFNEIDIFDLEKKYKPRPTKTIGVNDYVQTNFI